MPASQETVDLLNRCLDNSGAIEAMIASGALPGADPQDQAAALSTPDTP